MIAFLEGKKTYLIAAIVAGLGIAEALGVVLAPWIWPLTAALGLGSLRSGVKSTSKAIVRSQR